MKLGRLTAGIIATFTAATLFTACSDDDPGTVPLGSGAPLGGPSNPNNTSVVEKTPDQTAEAQAQQAIRAFYSVWNKVNTDISANIDDLNNVAGDPLLKEFRGELISTRSKGITSTGELKITTMDPVRVDVPVGSGQADVEVKTCIDPSSFTATWPSGASAIDPKRPTRVLQQFYVRNEDWPNDSGWKVVGQSIERNTPCGG